MSIPLPSLPPELISLFANILLDDVVDYISFRAVCHEWRACTASPGGLDSCFRPRRWIMLSKGDDANLDKSCHRFLNLSTGRCLILHLPELHNYSVFSDSDGLLFLIDFPTRAVRLFNPFTRHLAHLPTLPFYSGFETNFSSSAISTGSCPTVMLLHKSSLGAVYFAKPGDSNWVVFHFKGACPSSMLCFRDQLYFAHPRRGIESFHFKKRSLRLVIPPERITLGTFDSCYLAEFNKQMLLLTHKYHSSFSVYRVDLQSTGLAPVVNNEDLAIFLGERCFALSLNWSSSLKPNSVYYCEAMEEGCSITVCNMDDQKVVGFMFLGDLECPLIRPLTLAQHLAAYSLSSY